MYLGKAGRGELKDGDALARGDGVGEDAAGIVGAKVVKGEKHRAETDT